MKIKQIPEDFVVDEVFDIPLKEAGEYTYFLLKKKNWTTPRAIQQIARACRVSKVRFGFSGNKDKNAITTQLISAWKIPKEQLEFVKIKDLELKVLGYGDERVTLGTHTKNHFEIVCRDVKKTEEKRFEKNLAGIKQKGFPNYFGSQRFGSAGNTHKVGKAILKGELEKAAKEFLTAHSENPEGKKAAEFAKKNWGKWNQIISKYPKFLSLEKAVLNWLIQHPTDFAGSLRVIPKSIRRIFIHAYQSWIFNEALKVVCRMPHAASRLAEKILLVPGFETKLGKDIFSNEIKKILKKEKMNLEDFKCKRMPELASEGAERKSFIVPEKFGVSKSDKTIIISFDLEKGAYATTLLSELFGCEVQ